MAVADRFDAYSMKARLQPALIAVLPVGLAILAWFPDSRAGWGWLGAVATVSGLTFLMAEFARDRGKRREQQLFADWGGKPTTAALRHAGPVDRLTLARYHAKLALLLPDIELPDATREAQDPRGADQVYESCVLFLLERTRSREDFPLVFKELTSYGFRRNLLGLRPVGLTLSSLGVLACCWAAVTSWGTPGAPIAVAAGGVSLILCLAWVAVIRPVWVKSAAEAYARRLLASSETLATLAT